MRKNGFSDKKDRMIQESIKVSVRYSETDQMGFVYYGNYAQYLEIGRVAAMKKAGISYQAMEESGIGLPVMNLHIDYKRAARYDDEIRIETTVKEMPSNRIVFDYEIYREEELLIVGNTTLFFMDLQSKRACRPPQFFIEKMRPFFE